MNVLHTSVYTTEVYSIQYYSVYNTIHTSFPPLINIKPFEITAKIYIVAHIYITQHSRNLKKVLITIYHSVYSTLYTNIDFQINSRE